MPPFEIIRDTFVFAILPASLLAGLLLWLVNRFTGLSSLAAAIAFAVAAFVGQTLHGELSLASGESSWNRLPLVAGLALACGVCLRPWNSIVLSVGFRAAFAGTATWWILPAPTIQDSPWLAVLTAVNVFALWLVLEHRAACPPGGDVPLTLAIAFVIASIVFVYAGSARLMDAAVVLFAVCGGMGLVAWWKRLDVGPMVAGPAVLLPGLCLMAQQETFSEVWPPTFFMPSLAPLLLAISLAVPAGWQLRARIAGIAITAIVLLATVILAMQAGPLEF